MRRYFVIISLTLTVLFDTGSGECSLWKFDFTGHITDLGVTEATKPAVENWLGVSTGSTMTSSVIYNSNAIFSYSDAWDSYEMYNKGTPLNVILNFDTFFVDCYNEFNIFKENYYLNTWDVVYGNIATGGRVYHQDGWSSLVMGASFITLLNKNHIPFTFDSFPYLLNTDNFNMEFGFGAFYSDPYDPNYLEASISGVIDTVTVSPVPEPSSLLLLGSGLIGLIGYSRRRVKK